MANPNQTFELSLLDRWRAGSVPGILRNILINAGADPLSVIESSDGLTSKVSLYLKSRKEARALEKKLKSVRLKGILVRTKILRPQDWQSRWKDDFKPFALTRTIEVVPAWQKKSYKPKKPKAVYIDTTFAFGSGLHETTRFMAQLIEGSRGQFENFLDLGTGTGILSLVAHKNGAQHIRALDIQKESIRTAKENFRINGCQGAGVQCRDLARLKGKKEFDFVAANLITFELLRLKKNILSFVKPGGLLAVSGISLENLRILKKSFQKLPLRCIKIRTGKEWAAVLYKRKP